MDAEQKDFRSYFEQRPLEDRYLSSPDRAVDVVIPILHTNELWLNNLLSVYREIPVNRLLLGDGGCVDDSILIASRFPRVQVLDHRAFKSLGYSIRHLIEAVETDWFVYLHSDVFLPDGWFDAMCEGHGQYDWFECKQYTTVFLRHLNSSPDLDRAYSGAQMGRKAAFSGVLPRIDDDFLYRNEDVILARLVNAAGFRYGKIDGTFIDHQQMMKESPWLRRVKEVSYQLELGRDEEVRAALTYVKGIVKYLSPEQGADLIPGLQANLRRLVQLEAMSSLEFARWVADTNPAWSKVFPLPDADEPSRPIVAVSTPQAVSTAPPRLNDRLRWAPSAVFRHVSNVCDRISRALAPGSIS